MAAIPVRVLPRGGGVTAPAIVVRGATVALCRRTNFRKAFLAPWHEEVAGIWLYSLAIAQRNTNVAIHQTTLVLNHHHTEVTSTEANLPDFKRLLHGESSSMCATKIRPRKSRPRCSMSVAPSAALRRLPTPRRALAAPARAEHLGRIPPSQPPPPAEHLGPSRAPRTDPARARLLA